MVAVGTGVVFASARQLRAQTVAASASNGIEVQTRGPVHEAFAEPIAFDSVAALVVSQAPPAPFEEVAPAIKPAGSHVVWLPGYWGWDDDRQGFVWISGVWRVPPPGARWIPGYWSRREEGYSWTAGFWTASSTVQIRYLPAPPKSVEAGPSSPAPSPNHFYVPGHWTAHGEKYDWQAGYWTQAKPGWVWEPARYVSTPAGSVFVPGRWDYPLAQRGLLFAPVAIDAAAAARAAFRFTPQVVVNAATLTDNLFVRPGYLHYYFGDYYDAKYAKVGFQPWYAYHDSGAGFVPAYVYARWLYGRDNPNWDADMRAGYAVRFKDVNARPPHTWAALQSKVTTGGAGQGGAIALTLNQLLLSKAAPLSLVQANEGARTRAAALARHLNALAAQRLQLEAKPGGTLNLGRDETEPRLIELPKLPSALSGTFGIGAAVTDTVEESLPGVRGRVVPGLGGRTAPGLGGRIVPGVEQVSPGGGGGLPGAGRALRGD